MQAQPGQITWLDAILPENLVCPACGGAAPKKLVLETDSLVQGVGRLSLVACRDCEARYWTDLTEFHYEGGTEHPWATEFYVEQGAAIDALIEPISRLPAAETRRCLEIGCGFGFSIDAARLLFGWTVVGVDPSPLARAGAAALNIDIRPIYAGADTDLGGLFDVVYGSEVIEHVAAPGEFLRVCRAQLVPGGILVLTTPDADSIRADVPASALMPILSPGHHLVLFNAKSLEQLVKSAGFEYVEIVPREYGLVLYASDRPISIDRTTELDRELYRRYLMSAIVRPGLSAVVIGGFKYRLLKEFVNAGDYGEALQLHHEIASDCQARFGVSPDPLAAAGLVKTIHAGSGDGKFGAPFYLPGLLFYRGMIALNASSTPGEAALWFDAAAMIAAAFRTAYQRVGVDDGETGMIERRAPELALLALCHSDPGLAVARLRVSAKDSSDSVVESVAIRLLDLGFIGHARDAARLRVAPALEALVDGWDYLLRGGRNAKAHDAFAAAAVAGGEISRRARSVDMLALADIDPDAAIALGRDLKAAASLSLEPLFMRLVDYGHLAQADAIAPLVEEAGGWELKARRAMLALLHAGEPVVAARQFREAFDEAKGLASDNELWRLKYHELLAAITAADVAAAGVVAGQILAAGNTVPKAVRTSVSELLSQHPAVQPTQSINEA